MQCEITQRELRNDNGAIMCALDAGQSFIATRNGVPVAEMTRVRRRRFTSKSRRPESIYQRPVHRRQAIPVSIDE
jgi:antitoxin (DNA-binding transcriptional repressor) of toxin-antitoxin stability system